MKIESVYSLIQPLSHIGESESTTSFLNTIKIVKDGAPVEVFAYTGNAIRGAWRDAGARYLLKYLDIKINKQMFHVLFSGGYIQGDQKNDVGKIKQIRELLPFLSLFGGGLGDQIMSGKMQMGFALPVCAETVCIVPDNIHGVDYAARALSWRQMTNTIELSRFDDTEHQSSSDFLLDNSEQDGKSPVRMRYEVEYVNPGTQLYHVTSLDANLPELGAFVSCLVEWSHNPVLGGKSAEGFGRVDLAMEADGEGFISVNNGTIWLCEAAQKALDIYNDHIDENREKICELMG